MRKEMGIKTKDEELDDMIKRIDTNYIERSIMEQMSKASKPLTQKLAEEFPDILTYPITKPIEMIQDIASESNSSKSK